MQAKKQQLELHMEQWTISKLGMEDGERKGDTEKRTREGEGKKEKGKESHYLSKVFILLYSFK